MLFNPYLSCFDLQIDFFVLLLSSSQHGSAHEEFGASVSVPSKPVEFPDGVDRRRDGRFVNPLQCIWSGGTSEKTGRNRLRRFKMNRAKAKRADVAFS